MEKRTEKSNLLYLIINQIENKKAELPCETGGALKSAAMNYEYNKDIEKEYESVISLDQRVNQILTASNQAKNNVQNIIENESNIISEQTTQTKNTQESNNYMI
jgi:hypothetical protein